MTDFDSGGGDGDGGGGAGSSDERGRDGGSGGTGSSETADGSGAATTTEPSLPPDIEEPLAPIDITVVPAGDEPAAVATWWAATYSAYIGAEVPAQVAARLAPLTTATLRAEIEALPLAASYDDGPTRIEGAASSTSPVPPTDGSPQEFRITVETSGPIVIYILGLIDEGGGTGWRVTQARRL